MRVPWAEAGDAPGKVLDRDLLVRVVGCCGGTHMFVASVNRHGIWVDERVSENAVPTSCLRQASLSSASGVSGRKGRCFSCT